MSQNMTHVRLLQVPLEDDYKHTLYFENVTDQTAYFLSKKVYDETGYSYLRKDGVLRYPRDLDTLLGHVNYIMYQNRAHSNKWFYAFITKMEYVNDGMTNIYFETDVIQTWKFDYRVRASYIEREHCANDEIGWNTIEEGLEKGAYICNEHEKVAELTNTRVVMGSTVSPSEKEKDVGAIYNGLYSGVKYYSFETEAEVTQALQTLADDTMEDAVTSLFIAPHVAINSTYGAVEESSSVYTMNKQINKDLDEQFAGQYTPDNNKLYTYPYCYMLVTNGNGASAIYNYEDFSTEACNFKIISALCPGVSVRLIPQNYKGIQENFDEGLNLGKYPSCNWATDMYTNWLTQNGVNVATSIINTGAGVLGGLAFGGPTGAIAGAVGGATAIANSMNEIHKAQLMPPQTEGNINAGDVITSSKNNTFHFYKMSIKPEYARSIDEYFNAFGYKSHRVKVPYENHRRNYWYTQTIDVNIDGAVPMEDMKKIKECYNKGITFWKDPDNIQNYTVINNITI